MTPWSAITSANYTSKVCNLTDVDGNVFDRYIESPIMLNSTLCACTRLICCILENYQTPLGVVVPEVLLRYMPPAMLKTDEEGRKYMPFIEELKVEEVAKKKKGGKSKKSKKKKGAAGESKEAAVPKAPSTAGK